MVFEESNYLECSRCELARLFPLLGEKEREVFEGKDFIDMLGALTANSVHVRL